MEDSTFNAAVCVQVLEYVDDVARALSETHRVLSPGGRALVIDTDWDAVVWHSAEADRMARVKRAWEEHCADPRLPRTLTPRLRAVGFDTLAVIGFPIIDTSLEPSTLSHALVGLSIDFIARQGTVPRNDLNGWAAELHALSDEGRYFFSLMRCFFLVAKIADAPSVTGGAGASPRARDPGSAPRGSGRPSTFTPVARFRDELLTLAGSRRDRHHHI